MNYYERYCGDYGRDTSHLSLGQHGAYTLLLDAYYSNERPLQPGYESLDRICRAMTKAEKGDVKKVADEFFPVGTDGLRHNPRADRDIAKARKRIDAARENGPKGGRPRKTHEEPTGLSKQNPSGSHNETQHEPSSNPRETQPGEALPHATRQQSPSDKTGGRARLKTPKVSLPDDFNVSDRVREWASDKGYNRLDDYLESFIGKAKANAYRYADWDDAFMNSIREDWGKIREPRRSNGQAKTVHDKRSATARAMYSSTDDNDDDISGEAERVA